LPEKGQGSTAPDRGFGESSPGLWSSLDPVGSSLRTSVLCGLAGLTESRLTWRLKDTPSGRLWWVLGRSGPRTDESGSGSLGIEWRSPTREEAGPRIETLATKDGELRLGERLYRSGGVHQSVTLGLQAEIEKRLAWTTPTQDDAGGRTTKYQQGGTSLSAQMTDAANGLWASPQARDWKGARAPGATPGPLLPDQVLTPERWGLAGPPAPESPSTNGKSRGWPTPNVTKGDTLETLGGTGNPFRGTSMGRGVLNSRWVAQLQGYPSDWLDVGTERASRLWATRSSAKSSPSSAKPSQKRRG